MLRKTLVLVLLLFWAHTADSRIASAVPAVQKSAHSLDQARINDAVQAIETKHHKLTENRRNQIDRDIMSASKLTGVDPILLVAVIRVESDFKKIYRLWPECKDPNSDFCRADCGITQHHLEGPKNWVLRRCRYYVRNVNAVVLKSAEELASHVEYCNSKSRDSTQYRCVLNRYNGGPFYRTHRKCNRSVRRCRQQCTTDERLYTERASCLRLCRRSYYRCRTISNYWRRVRCFEYGARNGKTPFRNCRTIWRIREIPTKFYK